MNRRETVEKVLHGLGEQVVGPVHVGVEGVAATTLGRLADVEHGAPERDLFARHVRMPAVAGRERRVGVGVYGQDLRMCDLRTAQLRVDVQATEAPAQSLVLLTREVLVGEDQHHPVAQGAAHLLLLLARKAC